MLSNAELVQCEQLLLYARDEVTKKPQVLADLGLAELLTARAIHCPHAFCLALRTTAGYKLAYSGDTRPCQNFRDICARGGGPDLLIHEATMEHFMMSDARAVQNYFLTLTLTPKLILLLCKTGVVHN